MSPLPHCILSTPLTDAVADPLKKAIADSGAGGVLLTGAVPVIGEDSDAARERIEALGKLPGLMIEVDLARFPIDHDLVIAHPELFAVRRLPGERATIDPRQPMPATGEALARLRSDDAVALLADMLIERLEGFVSAGVSGFKLNAPDRIGAALLIRLNEAFADREVRLIAGPMGDRTSAGRLAEAGLDGLITSYGWWDFSAAWMVEEVAALRGSAPLIAEFPSDHADPLVALEVVPLAADAMIVPLGWVSMEERRSAIRRACLGFANHQALNGELRQASAPGDAMTVLVRGDTADLRQANAVAVGVLNRGEARSVPNSATLLQSTGAQMGAFETEAGDVPGKLAAGQAVLLRAQHSGTVTPPAPHDAINARDWPRIVVEGLSPSVEGGDFPVKRVVGDTVAVEALIFADGHEQLAAELQWRAADETEWRAVPMTATDADTWVADFVPERLGAHQFRVEGWLDRFGGFTRDFRKKLLAGVAQPVDRQEGLSLIEAAAKRSEGALGNALSDLAKRIAKADEDEKSALLLDNETAELMARADDRPHSLHSQVQRLDAERLAARFSSWYELFPRSMTDDKSRHGTLLDVIDRLPAIRDMGFDTLYFPPIHPIGATNRKGPNNTLTPESGDPGSPYAIGSKEGGHDAIHPELGSFADFDQLVAAAHEHGLEIALDFAIQCSPDHPWLKEHPGWFAWRPDGSMKYAENPPKKYQDIVNVDFYGPDAVPGLWKALRDVVLLWVDHGVKTFRVDNPHTKPLPFWEWMIADVLAAHPDVIFLAEAFTRPAMMYRLAKVGFSQSYTYFTWRDTKHDLTEYITELTTTAPREFYRPHFFVNTPDINPTFLQTSGRAGFRIRAVLAATLSGLFGVYSGFELCESAPLAPGKEEYLDSEKYEIRPRDYEAPGNIIDDITLLNRLRRAYPALQTHLNTRFFAAYDDNILWYAKPAADGGSMIMVMVNLDPHGAHECDFEVPLWEFGLPDDGTVAVEDLAAGHRFTWQGKVQHIRIAPDEPYRIWRVAPEGRP